MTRARHSRVVNSNASVRSQKGAHRSLWRRLFAPRVAGSKAIFKSSRPGRPMWGRGLTASPYGKAAPARLCRLGHRLCDARQPRTALGGGPAAHLPSTHWGPSMRLRHWGPAVSALEWQRRPGSCHGFTVTLGRNAARDSNPSNRRWTQHRAGREEARRRPRCREWSPTPAWYRDPLPARHTGGSAERSR